ncbi:MAG: tetratricopeptide repeat protein [Acetivibrionales bacterium]|jgi:tetratricopeptide (TPR) repeat protein
MTVINGFLIALMVALLSYSVYRLFRKRSIYMLIAVCAQVFVIVIAVLSFINDVKVLTAIEVLYLALGIIPPAVFVFTDYRKMVGKLKARGVFYGLVEKAKTKTTALMQLPPEKINTQAGDRQIAEILKDLDGFPEDLQKNFRKCIKRANSLVSGNNWDGAYYMYDALSSAAGSSFMLYYNFANLCFRMKKYDDAVEAYKKALELCSEDMDGKHDILYNMGNAYYMLNLYEKAARSYEKAIDANPGKTCALENLAFALVYAGDTEKGIEILKNPNTESKSYRSCFILANLLYEAGRLEEAEAELRHSLKFQPDSTEALNMLGKVLMKLDKPDSAIKIFDQVLRINPDDFQAWYGKAGVYLRLERWKAAVAAYNEAIRIRPDSYGSYYNMGVALDEIGKRNEAIKAYGNAIKLCPDFKEAYNNLGIALCMLGRHEEALEVYEEGIKRNPGEYSLYFNMGMCCYEAGRYDEAISAYRTALELKPDELEIYYYLGPALTEMRRYNDAIEAYESALAIKPEDGELHYSMAVVYAMLGRYDISLENLRRAIGFNEELRKDAMENQAFDGMRGKSEFKKLVS